MLAWLAAACNALAGLDGLVADRVDRGDAGAAGDAPSSGQVRVPLPDGGTYGIDPFETTFGEYRAWLATRPSAAGQPATCTWNDSFEPGVISEAARAAIVDAGFTVEEGCTREAMAALGDSRPVVCVDQCDAIAYCASRGRRLCGALGGGAQDLPASATGDPTKSEWFRACSNGGTRAYPYGDAYVAARCNDEGHGVTDVGRYPECEGGIGGLFDMSGNASEWERACSSFDNPAPLEGCAQRGGTFFGAADDLRCDSARVNPRGHLSVTTTIRCCGE